MKKSIEILSYETIRRTATAVAECPIESLIFEKIENLDFLYRDSTANVMHQTLSVFEYLDNYDCEADARRFLEHMRDERISRPVLDEYLHFPNPSLRFGKLYAMVLALQEKKRLYPNEEMLFDNVLVSSYTKKKLSTICSFLVKQKFVEVRRNKDFVDIFSGRPQNKIKGMIKWMPTSYNKKSSTSVLSELLHNMRLENFEEDQYNQTREHFVKKIVQNFCNNEGEIYKPEAIRKALTRWWTQKSESFNDRSDFIRKKEIIDFFEGFK